MRQHAKCHSQTYTYIFQMLYLQYTSYQIMWTLISLPLQMAECLHRVQPVAVANHVKAHQSPIEHAVTWLATETGWAHSKRSAICSGKLCGGFIIFEQCCPCDATPTLEKKVPNNLIYSWPLCWWQTIQVSCTRNSYENLGTKTLSMCHKFSSEFFLVRETWMN